MVDLLERHFPRLVDYDFTASMENELDDIADGEASALDFLPAFYFGGDIGQRRPIAGGGGLKKMVTENLGEIDARGINSIPLFERRRPAATSWSGSAGTGRTCSAR